MVFLTPLVFHVPPQSMVFDGRLRRRHVYVEFETATPDFFPMAEKGIWTQSQDVLVHLVSRAPCGLSGIGASAGLRIPGSHGGEVAFHHVSANASEGKLGMGAGRERFREIDVFQMQIPVFPGKPMSLRSEGAFPAAFRIAGRGPVEWDACLARTIAYEPNLKRSPPPEFLRKGMAGIEAKHSVFPGKPIFLWPERAFPAAFVASIQDVVERRLEFPGTLAKEGKLDMGASKLVRKGLVRAQPDLPPGFSQPFLLGLPVAFPAAFRVPGKQAMQGQGCGIAARTSGIHHFGGIEFPIKGIRYY